MFCNELIHLFLIILNLIIHLIDLNWIYLIIIDFYWFILIFIDKDFMLGVDMDKDSKSIAIHMQIDEDGESGLLQGGHPSAASRSQWLMGYVAVGSKTRWDHLDTSIGIIYTNILLKYYQDTTYILPIRYYQVITIMLLTYYLNAT